MQIYCVLVCAYADIKSLWIGFNDISHEMKFEWDDGAKPTFTYWGKDQPDDTLGMTL